MRKGAAAVVAAVLTVLAVLPRGASAQRRVSVTVGPEDSVVAGVSLSSSETAVVGVDLVLGASNMAVLYFTDDEGVVTGDAAAEEVGTDASNRTFALFVCEEGGFDATCNRTLTLSLRPGVAAANVTVRGYLGALLEVDAVQSGLLQRLESRTYGVRVAVRDLPCLLAVVPDQDDGPDADTDFFVSRGADPFFFFRPGPGAESNVVGNRAEVALVTEDGGNWQPGLYLMNVTVPSDVPAGLVVNYRTGSIRRYLLPPEPVGVPWAGAAVGALVVSSCFFVSLVILRRRDREVMRRAGRAGGGEDVEMAARGGATETELAALERRAVPGTEGESEGSDDCTCSICLAEFSGGEQLVLLHCNHRFHEACALRWLERHRQCPLCRVDVAARKPEGEEEAAAAADAAADVAVPVASEDDQKEEQDAPAG